MTALSAAIAQAMQSEYERQMAADNDGSPLPYIDWLKIADAAIEALELREEHRTQSVWQVLSQKFIDTPESRFIGPWRTTP